jgi:hypothetical protein
LELGDQEELSEHVTKVAVRLRADQTMHSVFTKLVPPNE